jgi:hypothetical protein
LAPTCFFIIDFARSDIPIRYFVMSSPANASAPPPAAAAVGAAPKKDEEQLSFGEIMRKASASAVRGGTAGAVAMGANVFALMWMRTTVRFVVVGLGRLRVPGGRRADY